MKKAWGPHPSRRGSEKRRAKQHGRSLHEQAKIDAKSLNKTIRGKGQFALNAQAGAFKHRGSNMTKRKKKTSRGK